MRPYDTLSLIYKAIILKRLHIEDKVSRIKPLKIMKKLDLSNSLLKFMPFSL